MALFVRCTYVNLDRNGMIGEDPDFSRAFTDQRGKLFRSCQKEYGRCVSLMYREFKNGPDRPVGWVFQGKDKYQDCNKTYTRETWVEVKEET